MAEVKSSVSFTNAIVDYCQQQLIRLTQNLLSPSIQTKIDASNPTQATVWMCHGWAVHSLSHPGISILYLFLECVVKIRRSSRVILRSTRPLIVRPIPGNPGTPSKKSNRSVSMTILKEITIPTLTCSCRVAQLSVKCELVIRSTFRPGQPLCNFSMWRMPCDAATVLTFDRSNSSRLVEYVWKWSEFGD